MNKHQFLEFPVEEREQMAAVCERVGLAPDDFEVVDETTDADEAVASGVGTALRKVSVKRLSTGTQSIYEAEPPSSWVEEFESDLECGLFGPLSG